MGGGFIRSVTQHLAALHYIPVVLTSALPPSSHHLKTMCVGIAVIDEDGVVACGPRPASNGGDDRGTPAQADDFLHPTVEERSDDALVHEGVAWAQLSLRGPLRHPRRGSCAAG